MDRWLGILIIVFVVVSVLFQTAGLVDQDKYLVFSSFFVLLEDFNNLFVDMGDTYQSFVVESQPVIDRIGAQFTDSLPYSMEDVGNTMIEINDDGEQGFITSIGVVLYNTWEVILRVVDVTWGILQLTWFLCKFLVLLIVDILEFLVFFLNLKKYFVTLPDF